MKRPLALALVALALLIHLVTRKEPDGELSSPTDYPQLLSQRLRLPPVRVTAPRPRPRSAPRAPAKPGELISVQITAYCLRGTTRLGDKVREGIIASDPGIFPLGKEIEVWVGRRHYGRFYVSDTGKDIQGTRLDIWKASCGEAILFGRRGGLAMLARRDST